MRSCLKWWNHPNLQFFYSAVYFLSARCFVFQPFSVFVCVIYVSSHYRHQTRQCYQPERVETKVELNGEWKWSCVCSYCVYWVKQNLYNTLMTLIWKYSVYSLFHCLKVAKHSVNFSNIGCKTFPDSFTHRQNKNHSTQGNLKNPKKPQYWPKPRWEKHPWEMNLIFYLQWRQNRAEDSPAGAPCVVTATD